MERAMDAALLFGIGFHESLCKYLTNRNLLRWPWMPGAGAGGRIADAGRRTPGATDRAMDATGRGGCRGSVRFPGQTLDVGADQIAGRAQDSSVIETVQFKEFGRMVEMLQDRGQMSILFVASQHFQRAVSRDQHQRTALGAYPVDGSIGIDYRKIVG